MAVNDYLADTDTVHIATELHAGGEVDTPIWAVVVDGVPFVRSAYGDTSKWYRRAQRTGRATFIDGNRRYPVRIENLEDAAVNRKVDDAYRTKYGNQGSSFDEMVTNRARSHTMRVAPR